MKLPDVISEAIHRRTNNTMANTQTKRQTMVVQNNTQKAKRNITPTSDR